MSYLRLRFQVARAQSDFLESLLEENFALCVTLENAGSDAFLDAAYPQSPRWEQVFVTGLFDRTRNGDRIVAAVAHGLGQLPPHEQSLVADQDWARTWLDGFRPLAVGPGLWVVPSWIEPPDADATNLIIDPGLAFGTGDHATTAMCLQWLARHPPSGLTVIDYGCGSGILAIAALKLGARHGWGVDVDPRALEASCRNAARNGVGDSYQTLRTGDGLPVGGADIVIANILANVLVDLADKLYALMRDSGTILLTGVLHDQESGVIDAFSPQVQFDIVRREQWSLLIGRKPS